MWFFLNLYLQQVLGYTAFPSGAALLPMTVLIMIGMITLAPKAIARFGPKAMVVSGLGVLAAGLIYLSFIRPDGNFWIDVLPASLVAALGHVTRLHPIPRYRHLQRPTPGRRPRRRHRQHQLPTRLRPRPGRHHRRRRLPWAPPRSTTPPPSPTGSPVPSSAPALSQPPEPSSPRSPCTCPGHNNRKRTPKTPTSRPPAAAARASLVLTALTLETSFVGE